MSPTHTLVDPFELALPTPTPSGVVPRTAPRAAALRKEDMRPAVHSETRAKAPATADPEPAVPFEPPVSDARARARGWCSEE